MHVQAIGKHKWCYKNDIHAQAMYTKLIPEFFDIF